MEPEWLTKARKEGRILHESGVQAAALPAEERSAPVLAGKISEEDFRTAVIGYAQAHGWKVAWIRPVRVQRADGSVYFETPMGADGAGWPDLTLVRNGEIIFAELKSKGGKVRPEQIAWLDALRDTGAASGIWYPADWPKIQEVLL